MQQGNLKKMLAMIGILGVIVPITTQLSGCRTIQLQANYDPKIVDAINRVNSYSVTVFIRSSVRDVREQIIKPGFIKNQLDEEIRSKFNETSFHLNKIFNERGEELRDQDLMLDTEMNTTFTYNYGTINDQTAKIRIVVSENRIVLSSIFSDFQFRDSRNVDGFLDSNYQKDIIDQASAHIGESLEIAGLTWENQTSNSILIRAKESSKKYQGEVTLTWNLKLFELWGFPIEDSEDMDIRDGLKLYTYLDAKDNKIKVFDVAQYKTGAPVRIVIVDDRPSFVVHSLLFQNNKNDYLEVAVSSRQLTSDVVEETEDGVDFTNGTKVFLSVYGDISFIRRYEKSEHRWVDKWNSEHYIDLLGNIN